mmetsp:Transcript_3518/g.3063  ORF Transcript_3518/g.3063 Transcript_3518/m.3063 type:complete len:105 (+) Transcript_3518:487-801(+)
MGEFTQKEVAFPKGFDNYITQMQEKAGQYEIFFDINGSKLVIVGYEGKINEFSKWLKELMEKDTSDDQGEFVQKEHAYSDNLKAKKPEIDKKATELEVIIDYGG